jgi:hypothetical protein
VCAALGTADDGADDAAGRASDSDQTQQVFLCPGTDDGNTYRLCTPCAGYQPLTTQQGQDVVPLCPLSGTAQTPSAYGTGAQTPMVPGTSPYGTPYPVYGTQQSATPPDAGGATAADQY